MKSENLGGGIGKPGNPLIVDNVGAECGDYQFALVIVEIPTANGKDGRPVLLMTRRLLNAPAALEEPVQVDQFREVTALAPFLAFVERYRPIYPVNDPEHRAIIAHTLTGSFPASAAA